MPRARRDRLASVVSHSDAFPCQTSACGPVCSPNASDELSASRPRPTPQALARGRRRAGRHSCSSIECQRPGRGTRAAQREDVQAMQQLPEEEQRRASGTASDVSEVTVVELHELDGLARAPRRARSRVKERSRPGKRVPELPSAQRTESLPRQPDPPRRCGSPRRAPDSEVRRPRRPRHEACYACCRSRAKRRDRGVAMDLSPRQTTGQV